MNQQIKTEIHGILHRNSGNRLTEDLIMGISVRLLTLYEKAIFESGQAVVESGQRVRELEAHIQELEALLPREEGEVSEPEGEGIPIGVDAVAE